MRRVPFFLLFFALAFHAHAGPVRGFLWRPWPDSLPLVLPLADGKTESEAARDYLAALESTPSSTG